MTQPRTEYRPRMVGTLTARGPVPDKEMGRPASQPTPFDDLAERLALDSADRTELQHFARFLMEPRAVGGKRPKRGASLVLFETAPRRRSVGMMGSRAGKPGTWAARDAEIAA